MTFRFPKNMQKLKNWVDDRGGSVFIRKLLIHAYEQLEGKEFELEEG